MFRAWSFVAAAFGIPIAAVAVLHRDGIASAVQQVQNVAHPGGASTGGTPSVGGACHRR